MITDALPRVATNGLTPKTLTTMPLTRPATSPTTIAPSTATGAGTVPSIEM